MHGGSLHSLSLFLKCVCCPMDMSVYCDLQLRGFYLGMIDGLKPYICIEMYEI